MIRDPALERLITDTRRRMLEQALPLPVMKAIAHQCFNTEYVFDETRRSAQESIACAFDSVDAELTYAAYRRLESATFDENARRRHIAEPAEERAPRRTDRSADRRAGRRLGCSARAVRGKSLSALGAHSAPCSRRRSSRGSRNPRILVAGCGTGQNAIGTALRFAGASVLAIDFSRRASGYAQRKTNELGPEHRVPPCRPARARERTPSAST